MVTNNYDIWCDKRVWWWFCGKCVKKSKSWSETCLRGCCGLNEGVWVLVFWRDFSWSRLHFLKIKIAFTKIKTPLFYLSPSLLLRIRRKLFPCTPSFFLYWFRAPFKRIRVTFSISSTLIFISPSLLNFSIKTNPFYIKIKKKDQPLHFLKFEFSKSRSRSNF